MRVVVTGAGGLIGAAVLARLVAAGDDVIGVVRRPPAQASGPNLRWLVADLIDDAGLAAARAAAQEADCVVHLAALRKQWGVPAPLLRRANVESGVALVRAMAAGRHFLFVSTAGVHGDSTGRRVGVASPLAPYDPYTASKAEAEREIRAAALEAGVAVTVARPGVVYGPGDTYGMVANMARLIARRRFVVVGSGRNRAEPRSTSTTWRAGWPGPWSASAPRIGICCSPAPRSSRCGIWPNGSPASSAAAPRGAFRRCRYASPRARWRGSGAGSESIASLSSPAPRCG